jgi:U3 small nucleolar RNA-associated protein 6
MAETVQYYMELMVPELKDLENKKLFTPEEVKIIIKRRQDFEYKLKRRTPLKQDFIQYIQYELALESLRVKRKNRLKIHGKRSLSDYAGVKRIIFIFERACRKFYGDKALWMDYISFAKKAKSFNQVSKICAKAIQFHPREPEFWHVAAEFEWTENGSAVSSRALFQRALRLNSDSQMLWLSYFKMELMFLVKVLLRREVLLTTASDKITQSGTEILNIAKDADDNDAGSKVGSSSDENDSTENDMNDTEDVVKSGAVPRAVFQHALKAMNDDESFKLKLLAVLSEAKEKHSVLGSVFGDLFQDNFSSQ